MKKLLILGVLILSISSCASVNITKTAEGYYEPTKADTVQILKTLPKDEFTELGTISVTGFDSAEEAKMHNAMRSKASQLGSTAVVITDQGMIAKGFGIFQIWASGVAIYQNK